MGAEVRAGPTLPAVLMRGGTSKGVFLHEGDLPRPGPGRDELLLEVMGSPDPMQIDGLGGTHSSTSKVVVVGPGAAPGIEVSYWFAQVGVDRPVVDWSGNCGNLTTAVAPFAIDEGLVPAVEPRTAVRLRNENTGVVVRATVEVAGGRVRVDGDLVVPGVPGAGAPVATEYLEPAGGVLGAALPTGSARDVVRSPDGHGEVTVLDVTHPYAFVRAGDLGLDLATATPAALNADPDVLARLERLRGACAVMVGVAPDWARAGEVAPVVPRLVLVQEPADTTCDLVALGVSMGKVHHALPMTGALCLAAAASVPGTVPAGVRRGDPSAGAIRVRHPRGVVALTADVEAGGPRPRVRAVGVVRTARRLMTGTVHLRPPEDRPMRVPG